jgi:hypothetical protein
MPQLDVIVKWFFFRTFTMLVHVCVDSLLMVDLHFELKIVVPVYAWYLIWPSQGEHRFYVSA